MQVTVSDAETKDGNSDQRGPERMLPVKTFDLPTILVRLWNHCGPFSVRSALYCKGKVDKSRLLINSISICATAVNHA